MLGHWHFMCEGNSPRRLTCLSTEREFLRPGAFKERAKQSARRCPYVRGKYRGCTLPSSGRHFMSE
jgi:hypothetical protein